VLPARPHSALPGPGGARHTRDTPGLPRCAPVRTRSRPRSSTALHRS